MKPRPEPEELEDTTTPEIEAEMQAAGDRLFASFERSDTPPDWRNAPEPEDE